MERELRQVNFTLNYAGCHYFEMLVASVASVDELHCSAQLSVSSVPARVPQS